MRGAIGYLRARAQSVPNLKRAPHPGRKEGGAVKRETWVFVAVGAVIGLAIGLLVRPITDVPLVPETGLIFGALVGWFLRRVST
jgi:hypothetical protein